MLDKIALNLIFCFTPRGDLIFIIIIVVAIFLFLISYFLFLTPQDSLAADLWLLSWPCVIDVIDSHTPCKHCVRAHADRCHHLHTPCTDCADDRAGTNEAAASALLARTAPLPVWIDAAASAFLALTAYPPMLAEVTLPSPLGLLLLLLLLLLLRRLLDCSGCCGEHRAELVAEVCL